MTVIDADGNAYCFPKPLTISSHTVRAVRADDLTPAEWRRLRFQSRLHSKGGRSFARRAQPIQRSDPEHQRADSDARAAAQVHRRPARALPDEPPRRASGTFSSSNGDAPGWPRSAASSAIAQLLTNTDDAYGFPPFRYLAPAITIGGRNSAELRRAEREILASFLEPRAHPGPRLGQLQLGRRDPAPRPARARQRPARRRCRAMAGPAADGWPRWNDGLAVRTGRMRPPQGPDPANPAATKPVPVLRPVGSGVQPQRDGAGRLVAFTSRWQHGRPVAARRPVACHRGGSGPRHRLAPVESQRDRLQQR